MAKRIVDGEGIWGSSKLLNISEEFRGEYANLLPLGDTGGNFECSPRRVWALVYSYNRPNVTPEAVSEMLGQFETAKMLFRWEEQGKVWGHFVGATKKGRLPAATRKYGEPAAPPVPEDKLRAFLANTTLCAPFSAVAGTYGDRTATVRQQYAGIGTENGTSSVTGVGCVTGNAAQLATNNSGSHSRFNEQKDNISISSTGNKNGSSSGNSPVARLLARFHELVSRNPRAEFVPDNWEKLWHSDMEELLRQYTEEDALRIIEESQGKRWARYIIRTKVLVEKAPKIAKQIGIEPKLPETGAPSTPTSEAPEQFIPDDVESWS